MPGDRGESEFAGSLGELGDKILHELRSTVGLLFKNVGQHEVPVDLDQRARGWPTRIPCKPYGIAFVKEARKRPDCRYLPIVMLTTEAGERRRQEGQMAGATAWVVKPFRPEQILHVVSKLVTR